MRGAGRALFQSVSRKMAFSLLLLPLLLAAPGLAKVQYKVHCSDDTMQVELLMTDSMGAVYLEQLKHYPNPACHPETEGNKLTFNLSLSDVYQCGVTRVTNEITGQKIYYHRIIVEMTSEEPKEVILAKCIVNSQVNHTLTRRSVLPVGFQEADALEVSYTFEQKVEAPTLGVGVRQGGQLVTGELNVNPGTPLQMEIYLDKATAPVYGLLVSYMMVTDTKSQDETIIFNGCSVDTYLFENFNTVDGDFLSAKFRAFKFPQSTYVEFKGTVNVCLDKCRGVECSNGQIGYGRRKREVPTMAPDPNKVFEITMTTFIKVDYEEEEGADKAQAPVREFKVKNDTKTPPKKMNSFYNAEPKTLLQLESEDIRDDVKYILINEKSSASIFTCSLIFVSVIVLLL
ncbi:uncharacterized protein LOC126470125 [Schistocerca serialis cubense]|uniref:uncharacterized protein LOC126470125 n=1 Tax=Schistocerca serialis cubense TaxID=2023355 RepID=UPI00214EF6F0|nr:uncharacterized protein LOC126470125 [Schistocerca serialis cubense]